MKVIFKIIPWLLRDYLHRLFWSCTHGNEPASAFRALGLKVYTTLCRHKWRFFFFWNLTCKYYTASSAKKNLFLLCLTLTNIHYTCTNSILQEVLSVFKVNMKGWSHAFKSITLLSKDGNSMIPNCTNYIVMPLVGKRHKQHILLSVE